MLNAAQIREEFWPMLRMAAPLALTEVGWLTMGFVDTVTVGRLPESAVAIGAVSLGSTLFAATALVGSGVMLGLDTLIAQAFGAGKLESCHRTLWNALYLAIAMSPILMAFVLVWLPVLHSVGIPIAVVSQTIPFVKALTWSTLPLSIYFALRRYLQAVGAVKPVAFALVSANLINLMGNWTFVYGHLGFPAFGVAGSGWSTCLSRTYMVAVLAVAVVLHDRKRNTGLWSASRTLDVNRIRELLRLGLPAATQLLLEIGAFAAVTVLVGTLGAVPLAGHQIALNVASFTYMVPLGIGSAAAIRVGHAMGARDIHAAARAGWMALLFAASFMACAGLVLFLFPHAIARVYSPEPDVVHAGATLLMIAAVFQLFDGLQVVATGALRGTGNTHIPMLANFLGYWVIGLPLGALLCFRWNMGAAGMWTGLCLALILIGIGLVIVWHRTIRKLSAAVSEELVSARQ